MTGVEAFVGQGSSGKKANNDFITLSVHKMCNIIKIVLLRGKVGKPPVIWYFKYTPTVKV